MKFSAGDSFSKFEQNCRKLRIFFIFAKKNLKKNLVFCAVQDSQPETNLIAYSWRNLELIHHCDTVYLKNINKKPIAFSTFGSRAHLNFVLLLKYRSFSKNFFGTMDVMFMKHSKLSSLQNILIFKKKISKNFESLCKTSSNISGKTDKTCNGNLCPKKKVDLRALSCILSTRSFDFP